MTDQTTISCDVSSNPDIIDFVEFGQPEAMALSARGGRIV